MHCVHVFQMALMAWLQHGAALPASIKDMCLRGGGTSCFAKTASVRLWCHQYARHNTSIPATSLNNARGAPCVGRWASTSSNDASAAVNHFTLYHGTFNEVERMIL